MSVVDHLAGIVHTPTVRCAECGELLRRRDAFLLEGEAFCCVLHQIEHFIGEI